MSAKDRPLFFHYVPKSFASLKFLKKPPSKHRDALANPAALTLHV